MSFKYRVNVATTGGDNPNEDTPYYDPLDVNNDAIECAGIILNDGYIRDELVTITRDGYNMMFKDGYVSIYFFI